MGSGKCLVSTEYQVRTQCCAQPLLSVISGFPGEGPFRLSSFLHQSRCGQTSSPWSSPASLLFITPTSSNPKTLHPERPLRAPGMVHLSPVSSSPLFQPHLGLPMHLATQDKSVPLAIQSWGQTPLVPGNSVKMGQKTGKGRGRAVCCQTGVHSAKAPVLWRLVLP